MWTCPGCGAVNGEKYKRCDECGLLRGLDPAVFREDDSDDRPPRRKRSTLDWIGTAVATVLAVGAVASLVVWALQTWPINACDRYVREFRTLPSEDLPYDDAMKKFDSLSSDAESGMRACRDDGRAVDALALAVSRQAILQQKRKAQEASGELPPAAGDDCPSMAQYQSVQTGMTRDQVVGVLGAGEQAVEQNFAGITGEILEWKCGIPNVGVLIVQFQNGRVVQKSQQGLR